MTDFLQRNRSKRIKIDSIGDVIACLEFELAFLKHQKEQRRLRTKTSVSTFNNERIENFLDCIGLLEKAKIIIEPEHGL